MPFKSNYAVKGKSDKKKGHVKKKSVKILEIFVSLFLLGVLSCRDKNHPNYNQAQVEKSFKGSVQIIEDISEGWEIVSKNQFTYDNIQKLIDPFDNRIYQSVLVYDPISLTTVEYKNQEAGHLRLSIFEMNLPLDAWGAYSRLRNPSIPDYSHPLLVGFSEGFYLEGRIVLYRGTHLIFIDHSLTQLPLMKGFTTKLLKTIPDQPYDRSFIQSLPKGQLIKSSVRYHKKKWPIVDDFSRCVAGLYLPHGTARVFICQLDNPKQSRVAFQKYRKRLENEMGLGKSKINTKKFVIRGKALKVDYFFYNARNYELHGIFLFQKFIFGTMGNPSQKLSLAQGNEILGNISFR